MLQVFKVDIRCWFTRGELTTVRKSIYYRASQIVITGTHTLKDWLSRFSVVLLFVLIMRERKTWYNFKIMGKEHVSLIRHFGAYYFLSFRFTV